MTRMVDLKPGEYQVMDSPVAANLLCRTGNVFMVTIPASCKRHANPSRPGLRGIPSYSNGVVQTIPTVREFVL